MNRATVDRTPVDRAPVDGSCTGARVDELVLEHLDLAGALAARYRGRGEPYEDLLQVARLGLVKAARRFREGAGAGFPAYAAPTITGELRRHFRDHGWDVRPPRRLQELRGPVQVAENEIDQELRRPCDLAPAAREEAVARRVGVTTAELRESRMAAEAYASVPLDTRLGPGRTLADTVVDPSDDIGLAADLLGLVAEFSHLEPRERRALELRFWHEETQTQIAADLGISQMQVSRILRVALERLRSRLDGQDDHNPVRDEVADRGRKAADVVPAWSRRPSSSSARVSAAA